MRMELADVLVQPGKTGDIQPCEIHVDAEGDWYHKGSKLVRQDVIEFFLDHLLFDPRHGFMIQWKNNRCLLDAADTPFVVSRADRITEPTGEEKMSLRLKYASEAETLDTATLWVGRGNVLYCRVREGRFPARFSRPAYYQIAEWIEEDPETGAFRIVLNGRSYPIRLDSE